MLGNSMGLRNREFIYRARYRIETDDRSMSAYQVINAATLASPHPFPSYFATFAMWGDSDVSSFMQEATCEPMDEKNTTKWIAEAIWSPIKGTEANDDFTSRENPLTRPVIYSLDWEEISIPVENGWNEQELPGIGRAEDTFGPICNAAGQEPSTPILKTKRIPVVIAEKNYATLADIHAIEQAYGDTLNNAAFLGYPEGDALYRGINASKAKYASGTQYYTGIHRVAFQRGGWDYEMVNRGWKYLEGGELKEATVKDINGEEVPVSEPINLTLAGTPTADNDYGTVINYRHRPKTDFSALGI